MDNLESIIWDTITRSAKTRFNYSIFEKQFKAPNENVIDEILFTIINEFAKGEPKTNVVTKVLQRAMLKGLNWEEFDIIRFVNEKEQEFKIEIFTAHVVHDMLREHNDPKDVLVTVNKMLNK